VNPLFVRLQTDFTIVRNARRRMGTHPGSFSGGEYWRWTSWAQTDLRRVVCLKRYCGFSTQARNGT
jgi:hypothetical protein